MSSFTDSVVAASPQEDASNTQALLSLLPDDTGTTAATVDAEVISGDTIKLNINGDKLDLDALGPMIVNSDGTVRRIANWDALTTREQEVAWRRIAKRNQERIDELKAAGVGVDLSGGSEPPQEQDQGAQEVQAIEGV